MYVPDELAVVLASSVYAALLSFGWGRKLCEYPVGRVLVIAGGVFVTVAIAAWREPASMTRLFVFFTLAAAPQFLRVVILYIVEQDKAKLERHSVKAVNDAAE